MPILHQNDFFACPKFIALPVSCVMFLLPDVVFVVLVELV
jgi:hypothetical protein